MSVSPGSNLLQLPTIRCVCVCLGPQVIDLAAYDNEEEEPISEEDADQEVDSILQRLKTVS